MTYRLQCEKPFAESDSIPEGWFSKVFKEYPVAVAFAIEAMPDDDTPVLVIEVETGKVVWDSSEEEFEDDGWAAW